VIEAHGQPTVANGPVHKNERLLTIPYTYRYTARLLEDVKGYSITVSGVQAPAGAPGYYAGTFVASFRPSRTAQPAPMDLWCFFPRAVGGKRENLCLFRNQSKYAAIAPTRMNPYLWDQFAPGTGTFDYVMTPIFRRQPVELPISPTLEYRFLRWQGDVAQLKVDAIGSPFTEVSVSKDASGLYRLRTVAGDFMLVRSEGDASTVRIAAIAPLQMTNHFVRVKLTIDAKARASECTVLESDAPKAMQEKVCEIFRNSGKFAVNSTSIEQTVRFQVTADQRPESGAAQPGAQGSPVKPEAAIAQPRTP
jgi:hypothetical protein